MIWTTLLFVAQAADGQGLAALAELPSQAQALRDHGLDADEVEKLLRVIERSDLPRKEAVDLVAHSGMLVQQHGPIESFADFVGKQITDGQRGAALHTALTAAHEGKKPPEPAPAEPAAADPKPATPRPARPTPRPSTKGPGSSRPTSTKGPGSSRSSKGSGAKRSTGSKGKGSSR